MIDCLVNTSRISNDEQNALFGIKKNLERIVITQKSKKTFVTISKVFYRQDMGHYLLTSLKDVELFLQNKVIFSRLWILCFNVL